MTVVRLDRLDLIRRLLHDGQVVLVDKSVSRSCRFASGIGRSFLHTQMRRLTVAALGAFAVRVFAMNLLCVSVTLEDELDLGTHLL